MDSAIHVKLPAKWIYDRMSLKPTLVDGALADSSGAVTVLDPSVAADGPGVLLIKKKAVLEFLSKNDCDIVWTVLGEKGHIGGHVTHDKWLGRLEVSGAYRLDKKTRVTGALHTKFRNRDTVSGQTPLAGP